MKQTLDSYYKNEMQQIINSYYENGAKKLNKVVNQIVNRKFGGVANNDMAEFYSEASDVIAYTFKFQKYNPSQGSFDGFLYRSLEFAFIDMLKKQNRDKRVSKIKIKVDGEEKKISIKNVSLDAPIGDDDSYTIGDMACSDFDMDIAIENRLGFEYDDKIEKYLSSLSSIQRSILEMKMNKMPIKVIREKLQLSANQYEDNMRAIKESKMLSIFDSKYRINKYKNVEDTTMEAKIECIEFNEDEIMDLDTTDSYRRDNCTLKSLIEDKMSGEIDCNYISQRAAFVWKDEQVNKFYSRVLNNQPVPEIVVCETTEHGEKVCYLVEGLQRLSYSEAFRNNHFPVKAKGAEFTKIKYKKFDYDDNGNKILDENGRAKYTLDVFDIVGKYYRDLPEFLQKRFDNYNLIVTRYFNCTYKMIDYHIRNYNNHTPMTQSQYAITNVTNHTSQNIKNISEKHVFFKDNVTCTNKKKKEGVIDETVARTIMSMFYLDNWKKDSIEMMKFVDKNATDKQFTQLNNNLTRLSEVAGQSVQDMFNTTNTYIWLTIFDRFTKLGIDDYKFIEFMEVFKESLHSKVIDGKSYDMVNKRSTKDKSVVIGKIKMITTLMYDYLHIDKEAVVVENIYDFVKENVRVDIDNEDIDQYNEVFKDLTVEVDNSSELMDENNRPSFIALVAYSFEHDIDLDKWIVEYFDKHDTYIRNQKENYTYMVKDLEEYEQRQSKISA